VNAPALDGNRWRLSDLLLALVLAAASVVALWPAWRDLVLQVSRREDNGYIYLVPAVALSLAWLRRSRLQLVKRRPSPAGAALALVAALLVWWGAERDVKVAMHVGAVLALVACAVAVAGLELVRRFLPAFVALLFLVPVPGEVRRWIAGPLQSLAVSVTEGMIDLAGVGVERQGHVLVIEGKPILVGEACDGLRMVLALALTFFVFVFSVPLRGPARLVLLAASPVIALACNIARLVPTGLAYAYASSDTAERFHDLAGWLMLPLAIAMLAGLIRLLRWMELPVYTWRFLQA
jgi:exosortase